MASDPVGEFLKRASEVPGLDVSAEMGADLVVRCNDLPEREIAAWPEGRVLRFVASSGGVEHDAAGTMCPRALARYARHFFELDQKAR